MDTPNARKNAGFATSLLSTMFQICGDVEAGGFPVQNAYKMAYGDEHTDFESLNPWPRPIIGTIHAKSTVLAYSSTVWNHATSRTRAGFEPVNSYLYGNIFRAPE